MSVRVSGWSSTIHASPDAMPPWERRRFTRSDMNPPHAAALAVIPLAQRTNQAIAMTIAMPEVKRALRQSGTLFGVRVSPQLRRPFMTAPGSDELDLLDLVIFVARRGRDLDVVADRAADQGPAQRRG